jgi:tRNA (guanine-N7-)-methyltransferase
MQSHRDLIVEPVGLMLENVSRPLNFAELFGNSNPVEMEIGMGKGTFLVEQAKLHPETNFIGIEYARWYWRYASDRIRRAKCPNVHTFGTEAVFFLTEYVPDASISVMHIYFPDPWPKKRHNKRRLVQEKFIPLLLRVLTPNGQVRIVTDHEDYFQQIDRVINGSGMKVIEYNRPGAAADGEFVGTNFERKYRREGRPFHAIAAQKV